MIKVRADMRLPRSSSAFRVLFAALLFGLLLGGNVLAVGAAKLPTSLSIGSSPNPAQSNDLIVIAGKLVAGSKDLSEQKVQLKESASRNAGWVVVASAVTGVDGTFSVSWQPTLQGQFYLRTTYGGNMLYQASVSNTLVQVVQSAPKPAMMLVAKDGHPKWGTDPRQDSNVASYGQRTHIAYESNEGLGYSEPFPGPSGFGGKIKVVTYDQANQQLLGPFTISEKPVYDEHGYPVMVADSQGYLHIVYDGHQVPLKYKRSLRPNDASEWTEAELVGQRGTYPHLIVGPNDTLLLFYRERGTKYDRWVELMSTRSGDAWSNPTTVLDAQFVKDDPANSWCVYVNKVHLGQDGAIYIIWTWMDESVSPSIMTDVGFARSSDYGQTWTMADGTAYSLPIQRTGSYEKIWAGVYASMHASIAASNAGSVVALLFEYDSKWQNSKMHQRLWDGASWSSSVAATGLLIGNIAMDSSGVLRGLSMTEWPYNIKYMEARPPYGTWTIEDLGSPTKSYYPTVASSADRYFEGSWQVRVASDHSELYFYTQAL